jgi:hypothetical protein
VLALGCLALPAQAGPPTEYEVKAAFLFHFAKFVEWPPEAFADRTASLVVGVLGEDPFEGVLERAVAGRRVRERAIEVRYFDGLAGVGDSPVHILFVASQSEAAQVAELSHRFAGRNILLVGESEGFAERGGAVNFTREGKKVRFEINPQAAEAAGLRLSSRLLSLATIVGPTASRGTGP